MKPRGYDAPLLVAGFLICWQMTYWLVGPDVVSSPSNTLLRTIVLLQTRNFWLDAESTGVAFTYACVIGVAGGIVLGLLLGLNQFAGDVADPILGTVSIPIPKITLYPIILLIFGLSLSAKVAFVSSMAIPVARYSQ